MPKQSTAPLAVYHALAHPARCAVVERLCRGPASTTELAGSSGMALPSFVQHLDVLEQAGLVASHKQGRVRTYRLNPGPLREAQGWLAAQRALWEARMDRFDAFVLAQEDS